MTLPDNIDIAVLVPCYNEEAAISNVVNDFRNALPAADIYVYDNNSSDRTVAVAREAGAIVRSEPLQGKGNVVRRMFADVEADVFVMADGDNTYDASAAPMLVDKLLDDNLDLVNGKRVHEDHRGLPARASVRQHPADLAGCNGIFGNRFEDMLSGYKVFSRRFAKSFPSSVEVASKSRPSLTVHALELRMPVAESRNQLRCPARRLRKQTEHLCRRLQNTKDDRQTYKGRTAVAVLFSRFRIVCPDLDHFDHSSHHYIHGDRTRSTLPDGHSGHWFNAARFSFTCLRVDSRHGHARPA